MKDCPTAVVCGRPGELFNPFAVALTLVCNTLGVRLTTESYGLMAKRELWAAAVSTGITACIWAIWWQRNLCGRVDDMQAQINDLRMDMIHRKPSSDRSSHDQTTMRRVK